MSFAGDGGEITLNRTENAHQETLQEGEMEERSESGSMI